MISAYNLIILAILDMGFRLFAKFFALNDPFRYVPRPRKHRFTWFWRQNRSENYSAISWLGLIQFFPATLWIRSYTRSTRCTHGRLIGLNEVYSV